MGESRVVSLSDSSKPAREAKAIFATARDALLGAYNWNFAMDREQLSALVDVPLFEFSHMYRLPIDCLRVVMVGDYYVGMDLTNYRGSPTEEFTIEGRHILTNLGAPLNLKFVKRVTNVTEFDSCFDMALAMKLAELLAEPLTQSNSKQEAATQAYTRSVKAAIRANSIQLPPRKLADDEWLMSRL